MMGKRHQYHKDSERIHLIFLDTIGQNKILENYNFYLYVENILNLTFY